MVVYFSLLIRLFKDVTMIFFSRERFIFLRLSCDFEANASESEGYLEDMLTMYILLSVISGQFQTLHNSYR